MNSSFINVFLTTLLAFSGFFSQAAIAQTITYTVGGTVNGLTTGKTVVLKNNTNTLLVSSANTNFTFPAQSAGTSWSVSVAIQPSGQTCTVSNPSGTNINANVTNVVVTCINTYTVGGTVSGLTGASLVLRMGTISLVVSSGATTFKFASGLKTGTAYNVLAAIQPPGFSCSVASGIGVITTANITSVAVTCVRTYTISGTVSGLTTSRLTLRLTYTPVGASPIMVNKVVSAGVTSFAFSNGLKTGSTYQVEVIGQPTGLTCNATNASGTINNSNITNAVITCIKPVITTVSTLAGSGDQGFSDGISSVSAFNYPTGVALSSNNDVYVTDSGNNSIRKVTPQGTVTTVAGSANPGNADGTGSTASFYIPNDIAFDNNGISFIADSNNHLIRRMTPEGNVTRHAGSGSAGSNNGSDLVASFRNPSGVTADNQGNIYVADRYNHLIRKITTEGIVLTLAGSGVIGNLNGLGTAASFKYPTALAADGAGNIYVADQGNHLIRKIDPTGLVTTLAGSGSSGSTDGLGANASFKSPTGVAVDNQGNIYVADFGNHSIRKIDSMGLASTIAGTGTCGKIDGAAAFATFCGPYGIDVDTAGNLYVTDYYNHLIRKITFQ